MVLTPSTNCETKLYAKGSNWVTELKINQSAYYSKLSCVIAVLTISNVLVRHHDLISGLITIAIDCVPALNQSGEYWSLSVV